MSDEPRTYIRDGRCPIPDSEVTSRIMSANKGKNTKPELILRQLLYDSGLRGYRLHWKKAPGRPDIAYPGRKLAIFVNGCYWHRCPYCKLPLPKSNTAWWRKKFKANKERDSKKEKALKDAGWIVLTVWECQMKKDLQKVLDRIRKAYEKA